MRKYCAFFLVTEDDFCLRETTDALVSLGVRDYLFCVPKTYWNGSIVPESKLAGIHRVEANLVNWGCTVVRIDIDIHEYEGLKYIEMETRVRNRCLRDLERKGYEHFLIIDGDEYWRRGSLVELDNFITNVQPKAATIQATLVVGYPGYPIGGTQEGLLVYVAKKTRFMHGRTTRQKPKAATIDAVFHFTSTRRTMDDTIAKHVRSSHYDDEDYDFDGWLRDKLPKLKPGETDCHMFKKWQIWPEVRYFTQAEWAEIPSTLHEYLGGPTGDPIAMHR